MVRWGENELIKSQRTKGKDFGGSPREKREFDSVDDDRIERWIRAKFIDERRSRRRWRRSQRRVGSKFDDSIDRHRFDSDRGHDFQLRLDFPSSQRRETSPRKATTRKRKVPWKTQNRRENLRFRDEKQSLPEFLPENQRRTFHRDQRTCSRHRRDRFRRLKTVFRLATLFFSLEKEKLKTFVAQNSIRFRVERQTSEAKRVASSWKFEKEDFDEPKEIRSSCWTKSIWLFALKLSGWEIW